MLDDAINIDFKKKYDFVISNSVFHYFNDLDYARVVLEKMIKKANIAVGIFDINDADKKELYIQSRTKEMSKEAYLKKYQGLEHLFYEKSWFKNIADELKLKVEIFDQNIDGYINSELRFNALFFL